jgi:low affinity Fe/Cu permease
MTKPSALILPAGATHAADTSITERFRHFARKAANATGSPWGFVIGFTLILAWAVAGPMFHYSEQWQLVVNTGTTIITFLMVFVIQNTQSRDSKEVHVKLDELVRAVAAARTEIIACADLSDEQLGELEHDLVASARDSANALSAARAPESAVGCAARASP